MIKDGVRRMRKESSEEKFRPFTSQHTRPTGALKGWRKFLDIKGSPEKEEVFTRRECVRVFACMCVSESGFNSMMILVAAVCGVVELQCWLVFFIIVEAYFHIRSQSRCIELILGEMGK